MSGALYSIGYATREIEEFLKLLIEYDVDVLVDVRSVPYSRAFHDYHQEALRDHLKSRHIRYLYLGDLLGPRSKEPSMYDRNGQIQFDRLMRHDPFQAGITRLLNGIKSGFRPAICCAEKEPAVCHRSLLIGKYLLQEKQQEVSHIHFNGALETQSQLEHRLMQLTDTHVDLLSDELAAKELAYQKQCQRYAYTKPVGSAP